jgi:hypothetical protein
MKIKYLFVLTTSYEGHTFFHEFADKWKKETFITCYTHYFLHIDVSWEIWSKRIYEKLQKKNRNNLQGDGIKWCNKYYFHYDFSCKKVPLSLRYAKKIMF